MAINVLLVFKYFDTAEGTFSRSFASMNLVGSRKIIFKHLSPSRTQSKQLDEVWDNLKLFKMAFNRSFAQAPA